MTDVVCAQNFLGESDEADFASDCTFGEQLGKGAKPQVSGNGPR